MNKRFRCGLIILRKDGMIEKIDGKNGGGTRYCSRSHGNMTFNQVHDRLMCLFELEGYKDKTSLYDFAFRPIYYKRYVSFGDYLDKTGLHANNIAIYLCAREADHIVKSRISMGNKRNLFSIKSSDRSTFKQQISSQSETNSFRTPIRNDRSIKEEQVLSSCLGGEFLIIIISIIEFLYLDYSFTNSSDKLIKDIHYLIKQNSFDEILMQILEYICIIRGCISSTIDSLIQQMEQSNKYIQSMNLSEITLYSNSLNNVYDTCQSTEILLDQNKNKFSHTEIFSTIENSFHFFYQNIKTLRNQWLENVEKSDNRSNTTTTSPSFTHSNVQPMHLQDHHEIKDENSEDISQVLPLSSVQQASERSTTNNENSLFQPVLKNLYYLLNLECSSSFRSLAESSIDKLKSIQLFINLNHESSICDAKRILLSIKNPFVEKYNELNHTQLQCHIDRRLYGSCRYILRSIEILFKTLDNYQFEAHQINEQVGSFSTSHDNN